ncbi:MAG TPA: hypothetical protein VFP05_18655 [Thermomicrobiales bacterium]|nr:hypothetical protein [Thermomicrobiales bacterium]
MSERDTTEPVEIVEVEQPVTDPEIALAVAQPAEPEEPGNPDSWLQWALVIGLLALFLICALLILIGWNGR